MNILYAIDSSDRGGTEQHTEDLIRGMYERGHNVFVWCPPGDFQKEYEKAGAEVITKTIELDLDPVYIFALKKFLKQNKIDVLHAHKLKSASNAMIAGALAGTEVRISHTHTPISEWQISEFKRLINIMFYRWVVNMFSTREIALTSSRKLTKVDEGIKERKLEIIPNGLSLEQFSPSLVEKVNFKKEFREKYDISDDKFVFGTIGRLSKEKGTPILVDAFKRLLDFYATEAHLVIAGSGPLTDEIKDKVSKLGLEDQVTFTGRISDEEKIKFYSAIDVFVFPSLAEGFGIVLIEAMAMALPIIASDLQVLQEVAGSCAHFFETANSEDLSDKMYNMFTKRDRLDNLKANARDRVEDLYTMKRFIDNYENLYIELLEDKK